MFFRTILGGVQTEDGWICPRRGRSTSQIVVQISTFLERQGWKAHNDERVNELVGRALERRKSFTRSRERAVALREGNQTINPEDVSSQLRDFGWNEAERELKEYQLSGLAHALTVVNAANFSVPGSGKTATALSVAAVHLASDTIDAIVVVGPLSSFRPWEKEAAAALRDKLRVRRIRGDRDHRTRAYSETKAGDLILLGYATAATDRAELIEMCQRLRVMLVVDESHRVKRFRGGFWAPALMEIARSARVRMILSGTPMPQGGRDLYSQLNILWPDRELTGPPDDFAVRVSRDFDSLLGDVLPFVSRTPKEALGLQPYETFRHPVQLQGTEAEIYELIESNFRKKVEGASAYREKLEALRRGRLIRLIQAATNPDLLNHNDQHYGVPEFTSESRTLMERLATFGRDEVPSKSQAGLELVRSKVEDNRKVVVWSNFLTNLDQFTKLVRSELGVPCFQIDGRVKVGDDPSDDKETSKFEAALTDTRETLIERFLTLPGAAVLVANPASCSESISLHTTCHTAIYLDRTYDAALFLQSIDRVHRLGLPPDAQVEIHILIAEHDGRPTIDELVDMSLQQKEARMLDLLEGAELQPVGQPEDPLVAAEGDEEDLKTLLRFLLGEDP